MKNLLILLSFFLFAKTVFAQTTAIPDVHFEQTLINKGYDTGIPDGYVQTDSINHITSLNISNKFIDDLTGIEDFVSLTELNCSGNYFSNLNLSNNVLLTDFTCEYGYLTSLDVSNCTLLTSLYCRYNYLTSLNVSNNTALEYLMCSSNEITSLDVSNNTQLFDFRCDNNYLTSLDISQNTLLTTLGCSYNELISLNVVDDMQLKYLYCDNNYLTNLDVSKNTLLSDLRCFDNNLTSLDITNNTQLTYFYCYNNHLTNLDISKNTQLRILNCNNNNLTNLSFKNNSGIYEIYCNNNNLISLDVSKNVQLYELDCSNNNLTNLNLSNGYNNNFDICKTYNNPNLYCLKVDNPMYSYKNWTSANFKKDTWGQYTNITCGSNLLMGNIYNDINDNCAKDTLENNISQVIVKAIGNSNFYTISDNNGDYRLLVDSNQTYKITTTNFENLNLVDICPLNGYEINSGIKGAITENLDFAVNFKECTVLSIEIAKERMRRCFKNNTSVIYKNEGATDEINSEIFIDYPENVVLISASETFTLVDADKKIYKFNIDTIKGFSKGIIHIVDSVICGNEDIRGYTQCIKTWITQKYYCPETKDTTTWDNSNIIVFENVECKNNSTSKFIIKNDGIGNMLTAQQYRFYYNNELAYTGNFQLISGDSIILEAPADGSTIRLEADQHYAHPRNSKPRTTIEGCGSSTPASASLGFWSKSIKDDFDYNVSEICLEIRDSYDPNDKKVTPSGITENNYVPEKQELEYKIRFQNTGNDIAYNVVIIDTLSNQLDPSTLKITGASHQYSFNIRGGEKTFLTFTFDNINLPDSTTNEAESHGFISFSISPINGIVPYTKIENFADIYFDFNSAVRTDTAMITALDTIIESNKIITVTEIQSTPLGISKNELLDIHIFPNPTNDYVIINGANNEYNNVKIYDIEGSLLINKTLSNKNQFVDVKELATGIYFIHLENKDGDFYGFKMMKQ